MANFKGNRLTENIKREIIAIMRELKDPRVSGGMLTVVRVDITPDNSYAKVYVSSLEGLDKAEAAVGALNGAIGIFRREIGQRLHLRKAPEIHFVADDSVREGIEMFQKLDAVRKDDGNEEY